MSKSLIVCVDDEKIILDSLKQELGMTFQNLVEIEVAESAEEALEIIEEELSTGRDIPIVISDFQMPEMKGDEFLIRCNEILPKSKRILLTGQATNEAVGNAVINAQLYRFIAKPWEREDLELTINEAFRSFYKEKKLTLQETKLEELNRSLQLKIEEQTIDLKKKNLKIEALLEQTIKGLIASFIQIIAKVDRSILDKALRMKEISKRVSNRIDETVTWDVEVASLICLIGIIGLDRNLKMNFFHGQKLTLKERSLIRNAIQQSTEITKNIPHFEFVNQGISNLYYESELGVSSTVDSSVNMVSKILRIVLDFDNRLQGGEDKMDAIESMKNNERIYDDEVLAAFEKVISAINFIKKEKNGKVESEKISIRQLRVGMKVAENIVDKQGKIILKELQEIEQENLQALIKLSRKNEIPPTVMVVK